jgi:transposase
MKQESLSSRITNRIQIKTLHSQGYGVKQIGRILKVDPNTVRKWIHSKVPTDKPRPGRPRKCSPRTKAHIRRIMKQKLCASTRKCAKILNQSKSYKARSKKISRSTIQNHLKGTTWGRHAYKQPCKPLMSEKNIKDRKKFCDHVENSGYLGKSRLAQELVDHTLWTDESPIELHSKGNSQNVRFYTDEKSKIPPKLLPKFPLKIMVAGGICSQGKTTLHVVEKGATVTGNYYKEKILPVYFGASEDREMFPAQRKITFMQDGAPAHTTNQNMEILKTKYSRLWSKGVWPGNSPDLNPVEHVWAVLQDSVFEKPIPTNRDSLIKRVLKTWNCLDVNFLRKLTRSFPNRIRACQKAGYGHTKY